MQEGIIKMKKLLGEVKDFDTLMKAIEMASPMQICFDESDQFNGFCDYKDRKIFIQKGMSESQTLKTVIHEVSHAILHDYSAMERLGRWKGREAREVEAEGVTFMVCQYLGIDSSGYSFPYISSWSEDMDAGELQASLGVVKITSDYLIEILEENIRFLQGERTGNLSLEEQDLMLKITWPSADGFSYIVVENMGKGEIIQNLNAYHEQYKENGEIQADAFLEKQGAKLTLWYNSEGTMMEHPVDFFDVEYDYGTGPIDAEQLSEADRAQNIANRMTYGNMVLNDKDKEKITKLTMQSGNIDLVKEFIRDFSLRIKSFMEQTVDKNFPKLQYAAAEKNGSIDYDSAKAVLGKPFPTERQQWEINRTNEQFFLGHPGNCFAIYQIDMHGDGRAYHFMGTETMQKYNLSIKRKDYGMAYCDVLKEEDTLDSLFEKFNMAHPEDFQGFNMYVSDIVAFNRDGEIKTFYVDSFGYTELRGFIKQQEKERQNQEPEKINTRKSVLNALRQRRVRLNEQEKKPHMSEKTVQKREEMEL